MKLRGPVGVVGALPGVPLEKRRILAKPKPLEKESLLRRYDRVFADIRSYHGPEPKSQTLERLRPILYELSPDLKAWTGDARLRAYLLMQELRGGLDDPSCLEASLGLLVLILSKGGSPAIEMAKPMFREKVIQMYQEPAHKKDRFLPRLLLMLDDYDANIVQTLTKEAIHVWDDEQFRAAGEYLGLEELRGRDVRRKLKAFLGSQIAQAGINLNNKALDRAVELYHEVT